jgi:hypothetical protein
MLKFYPNVPIDNNNNSLSLRSAYELMGDKFPLSDLSDYIFNNDSKLKSNKKKINFDPNTNFNNVRENNDIHNNLIDDFFVEDKNINLASSQLLSRIPDQKYILKTDEKSLLRLPENYETGDETEKKFIENINERSKEWKKITTKNPDIQIYNKTIGDKKAFITKSFALIPFTLQEVKELMGNKDFLSKLDSIYKTTPKILGYEKERENLTKSILYVDLELPKTVKNRDLLLENSVQTGYGYNKTGLLYLFNSVNDENIMPINKENTRVFIEVYGIFFDRLGDQSFVRICYQIKFENFLKFDNAYRLLPQSIDKWITDFIHYGKEFLNK